MLMRQEPVFQSEKRRKWVFGRLKRKTKRFHSIEAPQPSKETRLSEAELSEAEEEEHHKHALTVAIASAAAAEAAITAAQVAVEVVRLQSAHQNKGKPEEFQPVKTRHGASQSTTHQCQRKIEDSSAIKIQTAFRGYLVSFVQALSLSHL